jgi:hypothetical protein
MIRVLQHAHESPGFSRGTLSAAGVIDGATRVPPARRLAGRLGDKPAPAYGWGNQACILRRSMASPEVLTRPVRKALVPPSLPVARAT